MKKFTSFSLLSIAFLLFLFPMQKVQAQNKIDKGTLLQGHIENNRKEAVPFVTITLRKASDSSLVKGNLSDSLGNFSFQAIQPGTYYLRVQHIGYGSTSSQPISVKQENKNIHLPTLTLTKNDKKLKEVDVKASKPVIQHLPGQTIVNVENSSLSAGNTVMGVLRKSPGVMVDQNDNIYLNGKKGIMVTINGRPTHLSGDQLASILKNMPASALSKIELMRQPPAKYSAEGTAGIINLVMKKQVALGFNGSINAGVGYGQYWQYSGGTDLNYKSKKWSLYGNYNYNHKKNKIDINGHRKFFDKGTNDLESQMQQLTQIQVGGGNQTAQLGVDYNFTPTQTIGFVAQGSFNNGDFKSNSPSRFLEADNQLDSISTSTNDIGYNWENESANLHYNIDLDKKGSKLNINADYNHFFQSMPQSMQTHTTDANGNPIGKIIKRKGKQPNNINIYAGKIDYTDIINPKLNIEAGLKTSFVNTKNKSLFQINNNGQWEDDQSRNNHFSYKENVNAAYFTLGKSFNKGWKAKIGVRAEQTNIKTYQLETDSANTQNYFDLFPNLSLSKTINPNHILNLSYTRRIDRPNYQYLNPFIYYVDEYTYREGNPYLKPQYIRSLELSYTFYKRYSMILSYSHTKDIMTEIARREPHSQALYQTHDNLNKLDNLTLSFNLPIKITPWWQTYNSLKIFYNNYRGLYNGLPLNKDYTSFTANTYQSFLLPNHWKAELTGMYRSKMIMGPIVVTPMYMVSAGIEKSFWHQKADIKLNLQDIFQSIDFTGEMNFGDIHTRQNIHAYRRALHLTFTWHFGNQKVKVKQYKNTGIQKEENRIQKGKGDSKM